MLFRKKAYQVMELAVYCFILSVFIQAPAVQMFLMALGVKWLVDTMLVHFNLDVVPAMTHTHRFDTTMNWGFAASLLFCVLLENLFAISVYWGLVPGVSIGVLIYLSHNKSSLEGG